MSRTRNFFHFKYIGGSSAATQAGFSIVELFVVVLILLVLTTISIALAANYKQHYKSEDQSLLIMDNMREASQLALTKRRTYRVEIDQTANTFNIIDENGPNPNALVKSLPLEPISNIRMDAAPTGIVAPAPPDYAPAVYAADTIGHQSGGPTVIGNIVWAARFRSDGSVVDAAGVPVSATIFVWPPLAPANTSARYDREVRSLTIFGGSGSMGYWKYDGATFVPYQ
ncbi:MAG: hypothetical protein ACRD6X_15340 [Pyrinomonadaceae bacterium]